MIKLDACLNRTTQQDKQDAPSFSLKADKRPVAFARPVKALATSLPRFLRPEAALTPGRYKVIYGIYSGSVLGYIGQTVSLKKRAYNHRHPKGRNLRRVDFWIAQQRELEIKALEVCWFSQACLRENYWKSKLQPLIMD